MTVTRKVLAVLMTSLVGMALLGGVAVAALYRVADAKEQVIEREGRLVVDSYRVDAAVSERGVLFRNFLLTDDERYLSMLEELEAEYASIMNDLRLRVYTDEGRRLLATVDENMARLVEETDRLIDDRRDGVLDADAVGGALQERISPLRAAVNASIDQLIEREQRLIDQAVESSQETTNNTIRALIALGIITAVLTLVVGVRLARSLSQNLTGLALNVDSAAGEIVAGTAQQVAGASQQAVSVQETVATADELARTAEQSSQWARTVADRAQQAAEVAQRGTGAVRDSMTAMEDIRMQVESIAGTVVSLAERAQDISGIVHSVEEIAEQVHLLGLNAAIEAARAGEHGRGFSVVAGEVRALADQSRRATVKISDILGEIQQRTNTAVIATEEGGKSVTKGVESMEATGSTIDQLAETVASAAIAAEQISASSTQQAVATSQISEAMRDLDSVTQQSATAARQVEQTARDLNAIAADLKSLVGAE